MLNTFFEKIEQFKDLFNKQSAQMSSPTKKSRKSPVKSPVKSPGKKIRKENIENASPVKMETSSPTKKVLSPVKVQQTSAHNQASNKEDRKSQ